MCNGPDDWGFLWRKKISFYVVDNDAIDRKLDTAHTVLKARNSKTKCLAPREGEGFRI